MSLSLFLLALYVFLESAPAFQWFTVDPKLVGFVGLVFVFVVVVEALFFAYKGRPLLNVKRGQ